MLLQSNLFIQLAINGFLEAKELEKSEEGTYGVRFIAVEGVEIIFCMVFIGRMERSKFYLLLGCCKNGFFVSLMYISYIISYSYIFGEEYLLCSTYSLYLINYDSKIFIIGD